MPDFSKNTLNCTWRKESYIQKLSLTYSYYETKERSIRKYNYFLGLVFRLPSSLHSAKCHVVIFLGRNFHTRQTFAMMSTNFCRDVHKRLPWYRQTFAMAFSNVSRSVFKILLCCSQTFVGGSQLFSHTWKFYISPFQNKIACLKLK